MLSLRFPKQVVVSVPVTPIMIKAWAISATGVIMMIIKLTVPATQAGGTRSIIRILVIPAAIQTIRITGLSAPGVMPVPRWEAGPVAWMYTHQEH